MTAAYARAAKAYMLANALGFAAPFVVVIVPNSHVMRMFSCLGRRPGTLLLGDSSSGSGPGAMQ